MVRYNTIRNLGPIEPRDRSAEVLGQSFASGMRLAQSANYMRMQKLKIAEAKQQARNSQLYAITKDIPVGFAHNVIPPGGEEVANNFLRTKRQEYVTLASQLVDNKIDPSSEEFFAINNQMNSIKSAITNYEEQMKKISQNVTVITDANNDGTLPHIPDNKVAEDFYIGGLKNGAMGNHDIDDNGNVLFFEMIEDPENPGELIRVPKMYNGEPMGGDNIPSITIKDDKYLKSRNELFDIDTKYLAEHEKYGKVTSQSEAYWSTIMPQLVKKLKPHELRMLVTDGDTEYAELITQAMLDDELDFYDKDGDGEKDINEMSYRDLYNNHEALQEWYIEQKKEIVKNKATSLMDKWKQDNPVVTGLPELKNPELAVINTIRSTENLYNKDLLPSLNKIKELDEELQQWTAKDRLTNIADYTKLKKNNIEQINLLRENVFKTTKDHLNRTLGYHKNAGGRMLYTIQEAYDFYRANADAVNKEWEANEAKFHNKSGEIDKDKEIEVDGVKMKHEDWLKTKPTFAENLEEWKSMELKRTNVPDHGIVFMNPSTNPLLPTTYTYESDLSTDPTGGNFINTISKYIADESGEDYNLKTLQAHGYMGFDEKLF